MKISPYVNNNITRTNYNAPNRTSEKHFSENGNQNVSFGKLKGKDGNLYVRALDRMFGIKHNIAKVAAAFSETKASQSIVKSFQKFKSPTARWCDLESLMVTFFYMWNTWKSEKIDEERKVPSMIQNAAVTVVSSTAALLIDSALDPIIDKATLAYEKTPKKLLPKINGHVKTPKQFYDAARSLKSNTIFAITVRFAIPVLMVPAVGAIVRKINEKKAEAAEENKENKQIQPQANPAPEQIKTSDKNNHDDDHDDHDDDHNDHDDDHGSGSITFNNNMNVNTENKFKALFA